MYWVLKKKNNKIMILIKIILEIPRFKIDKEYFYPPPLINLMDWILSKYFKWIQKVIVQD